MPNEIWTAIIVILAGAIAYFLKRILDNTEKTASDVADMKPKVDILWKRTFSDANPSHQVTQKFKPVSTP